MVDAADLAIAERLDPLRRLDPKQRSFVMHYAKTANATQSALAAGYSKSGASVTGSRLLTKDYIQDALQEIWVAEAIASGITEGRVMAEIATIAFNRTGETQERDKLKALEMLSRYLGLFDDKLDITVNRDAIERAAHEAGVSVDVLEAEYREITSGNS